MNRHASVAAWCVPASIGAALLLGALSAHAEPLDYQVLKTFTGRVVLATDAQVQFTPPVGLPIVQELFSSTDLTGQNSGAALADVGLPDAFDGGAQGLELDEFSALTEFDDTTVVLTDLFDDIVPLLPAEFPVPLVGAILIADVGDLFVELQGPLTSPFVTLTDPNVYHWAGVAPLSVTSDVRMLLLVPGQEPIQIASANLSVATSHGALTGTFDGDETQTRVIVGVDQLNAKPETEEYLGEYAVYAGPLGTLSIKLNQLTLVVNGRYIARNRDYGLPLAPSPPSGGGPGCGIGPELVGLLPLLGWMRRRRSRGR